MTLQTALETIINNSAVAHAVICEFSAEDAMPTLHIDLWRGSELCDLPEAVARLELPLPDKTPSFSLKPGPKAEDIKMITLYGSLFCTVRYVEPGSDTLSLYADIVSNVTPQTPGQYDLGAPGKGEQLIDIEHPGALKAFGYHADISEDATAGFFFYQTKDGFYFVSLKTLFDSTPVASYKYQPPDTSVSKIQDLFTILNYEFIKTYDSLDATKSGMYANRLISLDPISRTKTVTDFNKASLSGYSSTGTGLNRFGKYSERPSFPVYH